MASCLNLKLTLLAMSRALMGTMVSMGVRSFSRRVVPVSTMSTMTSVRSKIGAISMDPWRRMMSMSRLRAA